MRRAMTAGRCVPVVGDGAEATALYTPHGARKYLNRAERQRVLAALRGLPPAQALFVETLFWTGARISEVLALRGCDFQMAEGIVTFRTLKRRHLSLREVPLPPALLHALERHFHLAQGTNGTRRLWPWHRATAWRRVHHVMRLADLRGVCATPRGMRHGFAVAALQAGVPLTLLQRWLGHARLSTTAIYAAASGPEERQFAEGVWLLAA
jgi:integrase